MHARKTATIDRFIALEVHGDAHARDEIRWLRERIGERPPSDPAILGDGSSLTVHPIYIFLAIGFGALFCSWMNDSGFWVVGKLSGFTERETLASWTVLTIFISVVGLIEVLIVSSVLPGR